MRILMSGASGLLGRELMAALRDGNELLGLGHSRCGENLIQTDLREQSALREIIADFKPDLFVHCAAYRDPDRCAENRDEALKLNVEPLRLAKRVLPREARLVLISSDYVFDGENPPYHEQDKTNPVNFYGETKCMAETIIAERQGSLALRIPVLLGRDDSFEQSGFAYGLVSAVRSVEPKVMDNIHVRFPTWTRDVAAALRFALDRGLDGVLHYSGEDGGTQYELALRTARMLGASAEHIQPSTEAIPRIARRPRDSQLATDKIRALGFTRFTPFETAMQAIIEPG